DKFVAEGGIVIDADVALHVSELTVEFTRGRGRTPFRALESLELRAEPGRVTCLLGPNGSGKTTVMNVLTGLLAPTAGRVRVLGLDPQRQRRTVLKRIALVPQETSLYPELTAKENLLFHASYYGLPAGQRRARVDEALELVQLSS